MRDHDHDEEPDPAGGRSPHWERLLAMQSFATEALTQILQNSEKIACLLEQVTRYTCETWNESHWQTGIQREMQADVAALRDLVETAYPAAALDRARRLEADRRLAECCPPDEPKPICQPSPCPPEPVYGSAEVNRAEVPGIRVEGAPFPPHEIEREAEESRNEDIVPPVPVGPLRGSFAPVLRAAEPLSILDRGGAGDDPVTFVTDTPFGTVVKFTGIPPDMSGATSGQVALMTGNTFAAYSTDGGQTFSALDPTTIFPSGPTKDAAGNLLDRGLCCDQVIQYAPQIDRFIWLMQFCGSGPGSCLNGINKIRIAAASPQDIINSKGTAWTYWDLSSATFNLGTTTMDYPDMSVGDGSLYISVDAVGQGLLVMRIPLAHIQAAGTIGIDYTTPSDSVTAYGGHVTQNTGDEVFWAGHVGTSKMRIFSLKEGATRYFWRDLDINSWPNSDYTSLCPDGTDWLSFLANFPGSAVIGATRRDGRRDGGSAKELQFAWTAGRGGGFAHPHIQVVRIDAERWRLTQQWQIWNPNLAFAYPCLATNANNEVGISLGWGGGNTFFASHAVGILGDFVVWYSEASDAAISRWGDFVTARRAAPTPNLFAGVGYAVLKNPPPATGTRFNPRYILFGRQSDAPPPIA
jgi:hypothetical protein